jgi:hypothetical protein
MKRFIVTLAATLAMASAAASHVYRGLGDGDPDLYGYGPDDQQVTGVQPGVGDMDVDIYGDFATRNADLFARRDRSGSGVKGADRALPQIYKGFASDSDLTW